MQHNGQDLTKLKMNILAGFNKEDMFERLKH